MTGNLKDRICIIGAGPSGLYAAYQLEKKGYENISIFEKNDRVGGKCCSPYFKDRRYEMGAVLGVPSFRVTRALMEELGLKGDGPQLSAEFCHASGERFAPMTNDQKALLMQEMSRLKELLEKIAPNYNSPSHAGTPPELMIPFLTFCQIHNFKMIPRAYLGPCTSFGYGYFNLVPAIYYIKYIGWEIASQFLTGQTFTWKNGSQYIWETLANRLKNKPRLGTTIKKITRGEKIRVESDLGTEEFDKLIVSSPLDQLGEFCDLDEEERRYFSKIIHSPYHVYAFTVKSYPEKSVYIPENMMQDRAGHVMLIYHRWPDDPNQVITCYVYHDNDQKVDEEDIYRYITEDLAKFGHEPDQLINHKSWYYFPHISCQAYQDGWYETVESWQGRKNCYFIGEIMSFGDIEESIEYAGYAVDKFF